MARKYKRTPATIGPGPSELVSAPQTMMNSASPKATQYLTAIRRKPLRSPSSTTRTVMTSDRISGTNLT